MVLPARGRCWASWGKSLSSQERVRRDPLLELCTGSSVGWIPDEEGHFGAGGGGCGGRPYGLRAERLLRHKAQSPEEKMWMDLDTQTL